MRNAEPQWNAMVEKQLKTPDFEEILAVANLENLEVKPVYFANDGEDRVLPQVEENTHLVAACSPAIEEEALAILLRQNVEDLTGKQIFVADKDLAEHIQIADENIYFSLIDPFENGDGTINEQLSRELLEKNFTRNLCIDVAFHQNCGASIIQQLGIALGKAKELFEIFGKDIADKIVFRLASGPNYFFEIAKIRAFKILFREYAKSLGIDSLPFIFAETSLRNKTLLDPENNLIRSTLELGATMIAGADAVFANDFQLKEKSELSSEISWKQQIVLAYESIINVFADAGAGSYLIEDLTTQLCEKSWAYFSEIETNGGYLKCIKTGKIAADIHRHATEEQKWVEDAKIKLIGINMYPKLEAKKSVGELYSETDLKPVRWAEQFE